MVVSFVGGYNVRYAGAASGSHSVPLTSLTGGIASSPSKGDVVMVVVGYGSASTDYTVLQSVLSDGYTRYVNETNTSYTIDPILQFSTKELSNAETSVSVSASQNTSNDTTVCVHVWRGVKPVPSFISATAGAQYAVVNPPAVTTKPDLIIAVGSASSSSDFNGGTLSSSDMSNMFSAAGTGTRRSDIGIASYIPTSAGYDPSAWSRSNSLIYYGWLSVSLGFDLAPVKTPYQFFANRRRIFRN